MIQFAYSLIIAAAAAGIASGSPTPAPRYIVARNGSTEAPNTVLNNFIDGYDALSDLATQLMNVTDTQDIPDLVSSGESFLVKEVRNLQSMVSDFVRTGQELQGVSVWLGNGTELDGTTNVTLIIDSVMRSDLDIQDYLNLIASNATLEVAQDCGAAIACFRNNRLDQLSYIGEVYDSSICNGTCNFNEFSITLLSDQEKECDTVFCF
ncbi:hypothetical protein F4806DRAFT_492369 [Annulohypoxylon nitens]|nr:hypothetical protein F4806DRAFT_492369 [Annulohypoxylon nitens]